MLKYYRLTFHDDHVQALTEATDITNEVPYYYVKDGHLSFALVEAETEEEAQSIGDKLVQRMLPKPKTNGQRSAL